MTPHIRTGFLSSCRPLHCITQGSCANQGIRRPSHSLDAACVDGGIHVHVYGPDVLLHRSMHPNKRHFDHHAAPSRCQLALCMGEASRTPISACWLACLDSTEAYGTPIDGSSGYILCATRTKSGFRSKCNPISWVWEEHPAEHPFGGGSPAPLGAGLLLSTPSVRKGIFIPIDREAVSYQISVFYRGSTCCDVISFANERSTKQHARTRINCSKCSPTAHKRRRSPSGRP